VRGAPRPSLHRGLLRRDRAASDIPRTATVTANDHCVPSRLPGGVSSPRSNRQQHEQDGGRPLAGQRLAPTRQTATMDVLHMTSRKPTGSKAAACTPEASLTQPVPVGDGRVGSRDSVAPSVRGAGRAMLRPDLRLIGTRRPESPPPPSRCGGPLRVGGQSPANRPQGPLPASPLWPGCAPESSRVVSKPAQPALTLCGHLRPGGAKFSCVIFWPITPSSSRGWLSNTFATRRGRSEYEVGRFFGKPRAWLARETPPRLGRTDGAARTGPGSPRGGTKQQDGNSSQDFGVRRPGAAVAALSSPNTPPRRDDRQRQLAAAPRADHHLDPAKR